MQTTAVRPLDIPVEWVRVSAEDAMLGDKCLTWAQWQMFQRSEKHPDLRQISVWHAVFYPAAFEDFPAGWIVIRRVAAAV